VTRTLGGKPDTAGASQVHVAQKDHARMLAQLANQDRLYLAF